MHRDEVLVAAAELPARRQRLRDFGPSALKAAREMMVRGYEHPKYGKQEPLCRTQINARVKRIRRMFRVEPSR